MAGVHSMLNFIKKKPLKFWGLFWAKILNFGLDPRIFDAKTDPFIPFGANFFVYLKHIGIQIIEKITGKIVCCV